VTKAGKLYLPAVQRLGADQINSGLSLWLDEKWGSGHFDEPKLYLTVVAAASQASVRQYRQKSNPAAVQEDLRFTADIEPTRRSKRR
jgi:hypothetical protein